MRAIFFVPAAASDDAKLALCKENGDDSLRCDSHVTHNYYALCGPHTSKHIHMYTSAPFIRVYKGLSYMTHDHASFFEEPIICIYKGHPCVYIRAFHTRCICDTQSYVMTHSYVIHIKNSDCACVCVCVYTPSWPFARRISDTHSPLSLQRAFHT